MLSNSPIFDIFRYFRGWAGGKSKKSKSKSVLLFRRFSARFPHAEWQSATFFCIAGLGFPTQQLRFWSIGNVLPLMPSVPLIVGTWMGLFVVGCIAQCCQCFVSMSFWLVISRFRNTSSLFFTKCSLCLEFRVFEGLPTFFVFRCGVRVAHFPK